jgi:TonB-linked SusC/RagA family outer membrane protein
MRTRKSKKLLSMLAAGFFFCYPGNYVSARGDVSGEQLAVQQTKKTVTGTVLDIQGEPMIGVSVIVQETKEGAVTDVNGRYSIFVQNDRQTLLFSYIGYKSVTVVANKEQVNVTMEEDAKALGEVVVVGYGMQKKENLTGAVSSVDVKKTLGSRPIADVGRSLQGTVPGLSITIPNGEMGSDPVIRIRGQIASINSTASHSPLILLDNVEIPSIQLINPDDIESISVLKDAAASSIYGAKAALGVILITSKKGANIDKVTVSYSNNFSWAKVATDIDMATIDGLEYALLAVERVGTNRTGAFLKLDRISYERSKKWYEQYGGLAYDAPVVYGRDWYMDGSTVMGVRLYDSYKHMVDEWTPTQTHNVSVNGRSGKTVYNIGLGYFDQQGLMKTAKKDDFQRYNATAKLSTEVSKYLTVRSGFLYSQRTKNYPYITNSTTADPWLYIYRWGPLQPFGYDENGNILRSPASEAAQANTASRQWNYLNANIGATVNITKDWNLEADYTYAQTDYLEHNPGTRYKAANTWASGVLRKDDAGKQIYVDQNGKVVDASATGAMPAYQFPLDTYTGKGANPDHLYRESQNTQMHTYNVYSTYNLNLDDSNVFKFMAGTNIVKSRRTTHWSRKLELLDLTDPQFDKAVGTQTSGGGTYWDAQAGFFGRVNYAFQQKYLLEANLRYDGSSKFPKTLKWRWFPSFSAGWRASEEAFMNWIKPALGALKFRGSWGVIGDQSVSSSLYVPTLTFINSSWLDASTKFPLYGTPTAVDGNITWQDIETLDFGIDARLLNNELGITFDWYNRYTRNMITPGVELPYTAGVPAPVGNYGELKTTGWEIVIDYNHRFQNGLGINLMATLSDAQTYISDYPSEAMKNIKSQSAYYKGKRYGDIWGYRSSGLYQESDFEHDAKGNLIEIDVPINPKDPASATKKMWKLKGDNPVYQPFLQTSSDFTFGPGDVKYTDLNGDGRVNEGSGTEDDPGDLTIIGNTTPRYQYGFRLGADYKGFDFSVFFQGIGSRSVWGDGALVLPGYNVSDGAMSKAIASDFWRADRTDAFYPRPYNISAVAGGATASNNTHISDRYLLNMSYLRLKNITLGYSFPVHIISKVALSKARIYTAMENILTWDHLRGLPIDPEVVNGYSMWNSSNYNSGRTGVGAPMFKNVSVGIQLTF